MSFPDGQRIEQASQFRARKPQWVLTAHGMVGSMGQVGSVGDHAAMESFFALLQKNALDRQRWATRDQLRLRDRHLDRAPTTADAAKPPSLD